MNMKIRPAVENDIDAVLDLWERAAEPTTTDDAAAIAALLGHDAGALLVAEESGEIVGSVTRSGFLRSAQGVRTVRLRLLEDSQIVGYAE